MNIGMISSKITTCIVIPCYNESENFPLNKYCTFLDQHKDVLLCFVNDGSTDDTFSIINNIKDTYPKKVIVLNQILNRGKAQAVRKGVLYCNHTYRYTYIGYLDADLSTSILECEQLRYFLDETVNFAFASRIRKLGSEIERSQTRFLIGRTIATVISNILKLKVYDTQCGSKLFTKDLATNIFKDKFISKWLFDVEIFFRIINYYGRDLALKKMVEVPLKKWVDAGNSSVKLTYFFKLWLDLYKINRKYRLKPSQDMFITQTVYVHEQ